MPTHWTYGDFKPDEDLQQGDILWPTEELRTIFKEVHPHFTSSKYVGFLVLTQTCDLVRRDGNACSSRYINLAAIRSLESTLGGFLERVCEQISEGVYLHESRDRAVMFLKRVFNQNEQKLGLFYLHPDADVGIADPSVALLQVSIALMAVAHYPSLVRARRGRLQPSFQSKLGWLVGNLFSRVATQDWEQEKIDALVNNALTPVEGTGPDWVPRKLLQTAKTSGIALQGVDRDSLLATLGSLKAPSPKEEVLKRVEDALTQVIPDISAVHLASVRAKLSNDMGFTAAIKKA